MATFTEVPSGAVSIFEKSGTSTGNTASEALPPLTSTAPAFSVYLPAFRPSLNEARNEPSAPTGRGRRLLRPAGLLPVLGHRAGRDRHVHGLRATALPRREAARLATHEAEQRRATVGDLQERDLERGREVLARLLEESPGRGVPRQQVGELHEVPVLARAVVDVGLQDLRRGDAVELLREAARRAAVGVEGDHGLAALERLAGPVAVGPGLRGEQAGAARSLPPAPRPACPAG